MKEIWLPKSETNVTVRDGQVVVWESMQMSPQKIQAPKPGFANEIESGSDDA